MQAQEEAELAKRAMELGLGDGTERTGVSNTSPQNPNAA
jgi:hypothetical protein